MNPATNYSKAPITEAVIDLRVTLSDDVGIDALARVHAGEEVTYPDSNKIYSVHGSLAFDDGVLSPSISQQVPFGFRYTSEDKTAIWQSRKDGFTFSKLAPYSSWSPFADEAKRLWTLFRNQAEPLSVDRIAVRYINRIEIPELKVDLKDYFRTFPEVSDELPQILTGFFMQLCLEQPDINGQAIINQTILTPSCEGILPVVLDIDLSRTADIPFTDDQMWSLFEKMRDRKNMIFEACITDKARRLFQ